MTMGAVTLRPGVNTQLTQSLNEAGVSESQLIRYKDNLIQTYGGWVTFFPTTLPSTIRDIHAWQGIGVGHQHVSFAGTASLTIYHSDNRSIQDITPQTRVSNPPPRLSVSSGSSLVTVVDPNSSASVFNTVYFNTPIAIGKYLLNGAYKINSVLGSSIYTIQLPDQSSATILSSGVLPVFNTTAGSATIRVTLPNNNFQSITGLFQQFIAPTSVGGLTVQGPYQIASVIDSTDFTITAANQSSANDTKPMNGGNAQFEYFITIGPAPLGGGFGSGGFGLGGFGTGTPGSGGGTGTPITARDWTQDNWGEVLLACPEDGPIYTWSPNSGFQNTQVITQAPFFNGGIFISMPQQILVAWRSVESTGVQDPLVVRWCNAGDFTNWTVSTQTTAGSFHIPTGSMIVGAIQGPSQAIISTDVDVWVMQYVGGDVVFNFSRVGSGCGWTGSHAAGSLAGITYWCGAQNFFMLGGTGVAPIPCTVWDFIFQNINATNQYKVRCAVNSVFNEIVWFFPSINATENDSYVKVHIEGQEFAWDFGTLSRTAWADASVVGPPIGTDNTATAFQHETGNSISGTGLPSFQSGWWALTEGNDFAFVDFVIPDFKWGTQSGPQDAQVNMTFFVANFPGDTPIQYGPFTVTQATEFINIRARGRLMSVFVQAANAEFWRIGKIRYRFAISGRR